MRLRKAAAELVDIHGLVIAADLVEAEFVLADERLNMVVVVDPDAGAVHPAFVFVHEGKRITRVVQQQVNDRILED